MAVVIRMARRGAKKSPFYRLVVADSRFPKEGRFIETVGTYDPAHNPPAVKLKAERLSYWQEKGARLTPTVRSLVKKFSTSESTEKK